MGGLTRLMCEQGAELSYATTCMMEVASESNDRNDAHLIIGFILVFK